MNKKNSINWECFDELPSTNDYVKEKRALGQDLIVTALRQTGGKGTKGRSFSSEKGGVYLTKLTFYQDMLAKDAFLVMARAATSVCAVLKTYGLQPLIKWPNDVYVNGKKICGILIENTFSGNKISSSIVGIGVNICNKLPEELLNIATTVERETGKIFSVEEATERLIDELFKQKTMEEYLSFVGYMGQEADLIFSDERVHGRLVSVDCEGGLIVEIDGKQRRLTAAEVSVRI